MARIIPPIPNQEVGNDHQWREFHTKVSKYAQTTQADLVPIAVTVTASPFEYINSYGYPIDVFIRTGTFTVVTFGRMNKATPPIRDYIDLLITASAPTMVHLSPNDSVKVTYTVAPTITAIPR